MQRRYMPGSSRNAGNTHTFHRQMADVARADVLRALRKAHRLTQPEAADIAGVTLRAYQEWERENDPGGIKWEHAKSLGSHYGEDPETLVRRRDEDPLLIESSQIREQIAELNAKLDLIIDYFGIEQTDDGTPATRFAAAFAVRPAPPATPSETAATKKT